jgi:hypothetical protein
MRRSSSYAMRLANQRKSQDSWKLWRAVAIALLLPWTSRVRHRWHRTGMGRGAQGLRAQRVIALTGVALAIVALAGALNWAGTHRWGIGASGKKIESLAVLPLQNLSHDPEQEYFSDGMTDALTTQLSKAGTLRVTSLTSAMQYKGTHKSLPEIARELKSTG